MCLCTLLQLRQYVDVMGVGASRARNDTVAEDAVDAAGPSKGANGQGKDSKGAGAGLF